MAASMAASGTHGYGIHRKKSSFAYFSSSAVLNVRQQQQPQPQPQSQPSQHKKCTEPVSRREVVLRSSEIAVLGSIFHFSGKKPNYLGVQKSPPGLALCPATKNCVSTSENASDLIHYAPPWNYNPEEGRGSKKPVSRDEAMQELLEVIKSTKPDNYTPTTADRRDDYIRVEYESPILGFVDDVEFWFPPGKKSIVQYRSASRLGFDFFDVNRKRIKALRLKLEKKGWASEDSV